MFEAADIKRMLAVATPQLKAMILLATNCGMGNSDIGNMPMHALDLDGGWLNYPRPKTGIDRRCKLWPETVEAIRTVLAERRTPHDEMHAGLVFITAACGSFSKATSDNPISKEIAKVLKRLGMTKKGRAFYSLRHSFATIGGEARDQVAVNHIMGHADASMAATYRECISDERLAAVADFVRAWLWPRPAPAASVAPAEPAKRKPRQAKPKAAPAELRIVG